VPRGLGRSHCHASEWRACGRGNPRAVRGVELRDLPEDLGTVVHRTNEPLDEIAEGLMRGHVKNGEPERLYELVGRVAARGYACDRLGAGYRHVLRAANQWDRRCDLRRSTGTLGPFAHGPGPRCPRRHALGQRSVG
jgi:hypothetical protein